MQSCKFKVEDGLLISLIIEIWVKKWKQMALVKTFGMHHSDI